MSTSEWLVVVAWVMCFSGWLGWLLGARRAERRLRQELARSRNEMYDAIDAQLKTLGVGRLARLYREKED